jgi:beta-lactamase regulating signal transducer with metallopeptidase domain
MTDAVLEYVIGNSLLALPLAAIAWAIGRGRRNPSAAHLAWVLVLVRLAMPPVASVPGLSIELPGIRATASGGTVATPVNAGQPAGSVTSGAASAGAIVSAARSGASSASAAPGRADAPAAHASVGAFDPWMALGAVWMLGTFAIVACTVVRLVRFRRALRAASAPADAAVRRLAERAAADLGMPLRADVVVTRGNGVPFVWWCLGRTRIVLPASLVSSLSERELRLVLTHELAHVRRRDHLVRWLDWGVVAWLWWNPLAWLARHGLRASEEIACDALVLRAQGAAPLDYGHCLVSVAESITNPAFRAPVQACTMGDGGSLEERIRLIMSGSLRTRPSATLRTLTVAAAGASMLFGVACASQSQPSSSKAPAAAPAAAPVAAAASSPTPAPADHDGKTRTMRASIDGASSLVISSINGWITVVRDDSATSMQVTAVVGGDGWDEPSESKRKRILDGAKLVAETDASGRVSVSVDLPWDSNIGGLIKIRDNPPNVSITVRTAGLRSVSAETTNGSVRIEGDVGAVNADTTNGNIDVSGAASEVVADSTNGNVTVAPGAGAAAPITAETLNGSVVLDLPASWNGTLSASVTNGKVTADGIKGTSDRSWTGEDFEATVGTGGSAKASLSSTNGSIRVRRR